MKKRVAIVAGGDSSEFEVSLRSANGLMSFIPDDYEKYIVTIVGKKWEVKVSDEESVTIDKNDFSFVYKEEKKVFDYAYITIHGTPGENGILQGYFSLIGLPFSCCDVLPSALTFNKYVCNHFLSSFSINTAKSFRLVKGAVNLSCTEIVDGLGLPIFVKPSLGGSSFGVTKVKTPDELPAAIEKAFDESSEIVCESFIAGTEVTCGMYKVGEKTVIFPPTEVVTENEFFDYDAKYKNQSQEITPARISEQLTKEIQHTTARIYKLLQAQGIIRVDYIIEPDGRVVLLEVNTTPGMTPQSFIPQQVRAAGLDISDVMRDIIG